MNILDPRGPVGLADKTILIDSLAIMLVIVVPTIIAIFSCAWWYRAGNKRARHLPDWEYSGQIELVVWAIPVLVIILLSGVIWIGSHELDPSRPLDARVKPVEIQVVSLDWKWLFIYPDARVATINQLVVPAGVPFHLSITSASVMNAFFVPQLGSMIYAMNGMVSSLHLQADEAGDYEGLSAHFSGDNFSDMHFQVRALSRDQFAAWTSESARQTSVLDETRYAELARQGTVSGTPLFRLGNGDLFHAIVTQKVPPGPGPQAKLDTPPAVTVAREN